MVGGSLARRAKVDASFQETGRQRPWGCQERISEVVVRLLGGPEDGLVWGNVELAKCAAER